MRATDTADLACGTVPAPADARPRARVRDFIPPDLDLHLLSRRPPRLCDETLRRVQAMPVPAHAGPDAADPAPPQASVVVVTFNNLPFTKLCVAGLTANTRGIGYELIVVDNGSTDGTVEYLATLSRSNRHVRTILNPQNRGFAPANNQGLAAARGRVLVLLNNDTIVPPGWLTGLVRHLERPGVGVAGPVTNRIGNEAEIETRYRTYGQMLAFAGKQAAARPGARFDIPMPAMFCLAVRRDVYERVGPLDERFEVGMLEDDDYARRVRDAGYRLLCAEDVFVHHFGQASFGHLVPTGDYMRLLEANQRRYREKWGEDWRPYGRRPPEGYDRVVGRVREAVERRTPEGSAVLVVSRGDEELVRFDGRRGRHFPCDEDGSFAGCYPADGPAAVAQLEALRANGADFLVFPATSMWWLDHYASFAEHLSDRYAAVCRDDDLLIFDLRGRGNTKG